MPAVSSLSTAHSVRGTHLASLEVDDFTHSKIGIRISIRVTNKSLRKTGSRAKDYRDWISSDFLPLPDAPSGDEKDYRHVHGKFAKELSEELVVSGRINLGWNEVKREPYVAV